MEKTLVVALLGGKGVALSENAYRCAGKMALRPSYRAVGIDEGEPAVGAHKWDMTSSTPTQLTAALEEIGLSRGQASFVATGNLT